MRDLSNLETTADGYLVRRGIALERAEWDFDGGLRRKGFGTRRAAPLAGHTTSGAIGGVEVGYLGFRVWICGAGGCGLMAA